MRAEIKPEEVAYLVRTENSFLEGEAASLRGDLSGMGGPYIRLVPARPGPASEKSGPEMEIKLVSLSLNSLDGMYFAMLFGRLTRAGIGEPISGKAGHSDPNRASRLAVRDLALEIEKRAATLVTMDPVTVSENS